MKRIITFTVCIAMLISVLAVASSAASSENTADFSQSSVEFVQNFTAGWNLGNTFEATGRWDTDGWRDDFTVTDVETGWGNPVTKQYMFDIVARQGFNAVRLPVTWSGWIDDDNGYKIDEKWMARIKEVVGYAYNNNMYIIVNVHHDDRSWLDISKTGDEWEKVKEKYAAVWTQIANEFKDYDEHLILEGGNEIISFAFSKWGDWWGSYADLQKVNEIMQVFVDTVRATGGNNEKRYLMIPTLGAQCSEHQYDALVIPNNDEHCIVDMHWYSLNFSEYDIKMKAISEKFIANGIGMVFGECGIPAYENEDKKAEWGKEFFGTAYKYGIRSFIWDDGGSYIVMLRSGREWASQAQVDAITEAVGAKKQPETTKAPKTTSTASTAITYGDANGDGKITAADVLIIRKYLAKWNVADLMDFDNADANADGKITAADVLLIRKWLAKLPVQLGPQE